MQNAQTLLEVSAFSGLAGALLTQLITALNGYFADKRKDHAEQRTAYRNKRIEIGENFYFMQGEVMTIIRKNITVWQNRNHSRSKASMQALIAEVAKFTAYLEKLYAENWKYNLVSLYFPVTFSAAGMTQSNEQSQKYRLAVLDLSSQINDATSAEVESLRRNYAQVVFDMCAHYERLYEQMDRDRAIVKEELLRDFYR